MGLDRPIDITEEQRKTLLTLLERHLPDTSAWVYGSRVKWTARPESDLDLVVFATAAQERRVSDLRDTFEESNLPFRVDLFVWDEIPEQFYERIEAEHVVLVEKEERFRADEWQNTTLGALIEIKHGFAFKGHSINEKQCGDVLLTPGNFAVGGGFKSDKFKYFNGSVPEEYVLHEGDLLVTMTDLSKQSDTLGYPAFVPARQDGRRYLHNQRLGKISLKETSELDARYLYYVLCSTEYRHEVLASATGTTVKHTSPDRIKQFRFFLPPPLEQRAIAHVLGTLDDKIELNRRMNETLEAMARALFKSWFVDFDPVRAKMAGRDTGLPRHIADLFPDKLVDSELGEIPEGWEVVSLPEMIEINPKRPLRKGEISPYLDMANMPTKGHMPESITERPFGSGMRFSNGDTLVARITPCLENGKTAYVDFLKDDEVGWGSTEYIVLKSRPPLPDEFSYCLARSAGFREFAIQGMTGTSGRQRVPATALSHFRLPSPTKQITAIFGKTVQPLFAGVREAVCESRVLATLRDVLLPKLVSGKIRLRMPRKSWS